MDQLLNSVAFSGEFLNWKLDLELRADRTPHEENPVVKNILKSNFSRRLKNIYHRYKDRRKNKTVLSTLQVHLKLLLVFGSKASIQKV